MAIKVKVATATAATTTSTTKVVVQPRKSGKAIKLRKSSKPTQALPAKPTKPSIVKDELDELLEDALPDNYTPDLAEALGKLNALLSKNDVPIAAMRSAFGDMNELIIQNPELATEIMLPAHLGLFVQAAHSLVQVAYAHGSARQTNRQTKKQAEAEKKADMALLAKAATLADDADSLD
jgi:hypothetical protein